MWWPDINYEWIQHEWYSFFKVFVTTGLYCDADMESNQILDEEQFQLPV
jgi:hypothetical protein